jgi:hypothetical protein
MKAGTLLKIEAEATSVLAAELFNVTDDPIAVSPARIATIANIEAVFIAHGVVVPINVDRVIKLLPVILGLFGSGTAVGEVKAFAAGSPFSPQAIAKTVAELVPPGQHFAGLVRATLDGGIETQMAIRVGDHWEAFGEFAYHGDKPNAGSVAAVFSF